MEPNLAGIYRKTVPSGEDNKKVYIPFSVYKTLLE
jgi:hypothetical protein